MKALMTNSTHPNIFVAKIRDEMYIKHLREVQKINNREALNLKVHIKEFNNVYGSHQKSKKKAKQFELNEHSNEILRKNDLINDKIKNIRSMFAFKNPIKSARRSESLYIENQVKDNNLVPQSSRYHKQNQQKQSINHSNSQVLDQINSISKKSQDEKRNRMSLHYYLRKRQQQMIEYENQKLKKGILSQKSAYSPASKKNSFSLKFPSVKTARHNFNQKSIQDQKSTQEKQQMQKKL